MSIRWGCWIRNLLLAGAMVAGLEIGVNAGDPERGYHLLLEKPYLPYDFNEREFSSVWQVWPEPLKSQAEQASPIERRRMAFTRYGLTPRPGVNLATTQDEKFPPLQYVVDTQGRWTMNCFSCHGGQIMGQTIPGLSNSRFALQTMSEELREVKQLLYPDRALGRMEKASQLVPLGTSRGTTNAVMFGVLLMAMRDLDLNVVPPKGVPRIVHHDMDAPAWWQFKDKDYLYIDAYAARNHRSLMQFMLVRSNGPEKFREWENDFKDIFAYLESIPAPRYPLSINTELAGRGRLVFEKTCAECHGTYGADASYPNRVIPIEEIGTDRVRFTAIAPSDRALYAKSWFTNYGKDHTISETTGYLAPPLDGIWASAPYFHNGSVPTLWHVLHAKERPIVWTQIGQNDYDEKRVGLVVQELDRIPSEIKDPRELREYFNTQQFGKKASGHTFPEVLSEDEKQAVLEYLKTL